MGHTDNLSIRSKFLSLNATKGTQAEVLGHECKTRLILMRRQQYLPTRRKLHTAKGWNENQQTKKGVLRTEFEKPWFRTTKSSKETRERTSVKLTKYNAKFCEPEWFCEEITTEDELERQKAFKFRGDLAYRRHDFQKALCEYSSCLMLVPEGNIAIRRDVLEGLARSFCQVGSHGEAMQIAQQLRNEATNSSHLTVVLNLEVTIFRSTGNLREEFSSLQQLVSLYPYNHWHWKKLAMAYMNLLQSASSPSSRTTANEPTPHLAQNSGLEETVEAKVTACQATYRENGKHVKPQRSRKATEAMLCKSDRISPIEEKANPEEQIPLNCQGQEEIKDTWLRTCICFVRARLLFCMVKSQQSSFVSERNKRALEEIDRILHGLQLKEETLHLITEVLSGPMFEQKWFGKIRETVLLSGEGTEGCR
ncbi:zinc fingers and homeoboxes protein 1 isoform X2 [Polyodon spathula]|uniref:zinc fingers and homeoboxes protein 1 isoform X2 n=1 Tax=Polyodon spathula TaxID=7913 RepID=UPI001B7F1A51|nr:zinc fingers and homeoboxes protein 1 isoform X2 [Polyodon spathula]